MFKGILIYEAKCPFCRRIKKIIEMFDIGKRIEYLPIRSREARNLLYEFYNKPPYDFHFIEDDLCFTGKKAISRILQALFVSIIWPYSGIKRSITTKIGGKHGK